MQPGRLQIRTPPVKLREENALGSTPQGLGLACQGRQHDLPTERQLPPPPPLPSLGLCPCHVGEWEATSCTGKPIRLPVKPRRRRNQAWESSCPYSHPHIPSPTHTTGTSCGPVKSSSPTLLGRKPLTAGSPPPFPQVAPGPPSHPQGRPLSTTRNQYQQMNGR